MRKENLSSFLQPQKTPGEEWVALKIKDGGMHQRAAGSSHLPICTFLFSPSPQFDFDKNPSI